VRRADNLTTFMCRLSWNLGASTSWNPQGLSRPVMGLLYLYSLVCLMNQPAGFSIEESWLHLPQSRDVFSEASTLAFVHIQPTVQRVLGSFTEMKQPGHEADHSHLRVYSAEWVELHHYYRICCYGVDRDNFMCICLIYLMALSLVDIT
jgi:hypothetical protein